MSVPVKEFTDTSRTSLEKLDGQMTATLRFTVTTRLSMVETRNASVVNSYGP